MATRLINHKKHWTEDEVLQLRTLWGEGKTLKEICLVHGRTGNGIVSKLNELRILKFDKGPMCFSLSRKPFTFYMSVNQIAQVDAYMKEDISQPSLIGDPDEQF